MATPAPLARVAGAAKGRLLRFRREFLVVAYAVGHSATPLRLRIAGVLLILYLASPVDLVPLWVPFFGIVDDLILVPWGLAAVVRRLPPAARTDAEARAARFIARWVARPVRFVIVLLLALILLWSAFLWALWWVATR